MRKSGCVLIHTITAPQLTSIKHLVGIFVVAAAVHTFPLREAPDVSAGTQSGVCIIHSTVTCGVLTYT